MEYTKLNEETCNQAVVAGTVCEQPKKSHDIDGENFYEFAVEVKRLSGKADFVPVTISERTLLGKDLNVGDFVQLCGQYRSYNKLQEEKSRLILHLFAKDFQTLDEEKNLNEVKLSGFICKQPVYRKTPFEREICDVLLAINRINHRKSDYIPCILWGRNARFVAEQNIGCKLEIVGRIQSREYTKRYESGESEVKMAYEVSCQSVSIIGNISKLAEPAQSANVVND